MAEFNENFAVKNISLTDLNDISFIQIGFDTDGNFADYLTDWEFLRLDKDSTGTFFANNSLAEGITKINVIKLVQQIGEDAEATYKILAYREIGYTIDVIKADDAEIRVQVSLFTDIIGQQEGNITLNYLEHTLQLPQNVHDNIKNSQLPFQTIDTITNSNFPSILENHTTGDGLADFTEQSGLQRSYGTPVYYAGRGHNYSNLLWYYWNVSRISDFLMSLGETFTGNLKSYTQSLPSKIATQNPFIGFNARYGSYLYWYNISIEYICVIYVGSNHYNAIDVFIAENTKNIQPKECVFWDEETAQFRIKFNRWYNHLYFIADHKAFQINTNLGQDKEILSQEIKEPFAYNDAVLGDILKYSIRAFKTNVSDSIELNDLFLNEDNSVQYWQLEFSDIGDVLICSFNTEEGLRLGIKNIFEKSPYKTYSLDEQIDATALYDTEPYLLFNKFMIDNQNELFRLWGLYQTTLVHLQYFLKNNYTPLYLGEEYSIAWSNVYHNYLILFKASTVPYRRRVPATWLDDCLYIEQGYIKRSGMNPENIHTGYFDRLDSSSYLAADRGVCVLSHQYGIGAYRNVNMPVDNL